MKNLGHIFKTIDAYPKTLEDFTIRTVSGAIGMKLTQFKLNTFFSHSIFKTQLFIWLNMFSTPN